MKESEQNSEKRLAGKMKAKKRTKQVCGIAAVILATLLLLIGSFIFATRYRISEHDTAASPDGRLESLAVREPEAHEPVSEEVNFDKTTTESSDTLVPNTADIHAANSAESSEELPVFSGQDLGELLAEILRAAASDLHGRLQHEHCSGNHHQRQPYAAAQHGNQFMENVVFSKQTA